MSVFLATHKSWPNGAFSRYARLKGTPDHPLRCKNVVSIYMNKDGSWYAAHLRCGLALHAGVKHPVTPEQVEFLPDKEA